MENVIWDSTMRPRSLLVILSGILWYWFQPRSRFVVPIHSIQYGRKIFTIGLYVLVVFSASLIPLDVYIITKENQETVPSKTVQIVYDVSISMSAKDISPSRFTASRNAIVAFVDSLVGYDISLIAFAGQSVVHIPFSNNTQSIKNILQNTSLADFPPTQDFVGTAIGDALLLALDNITNHTTQTENNGIIILLTDGDSNTGIHPHQAISLAQDYGVAIHTIGIGKDEVELGTLYNGVKVYSQFNIPLLQTIADGTG